jgi:hypothetical protein
MRRSGGSGLDCLENGASFLCRVGHIPNRERRRTMLPPEEELLSDRDLGAASIEQLVNLRDRVNLVLQMPPEKLGHPRPGESRERPALD